MKVWLIFIYVAVRMEASLALLIVTIIVVWVVRRCSSALSKLKHIPPGPKKWLWFDNDGLFKKYMKETSGALHLTAMKLCRDYNSDIVYASMDGEDTVFIQKSDRLMEEFYSNAEIMGRPDSFFIRLRCFGVRQGLSMADGPLWEEQRAFAVRHLHNLGFGRTSTEFLIHEELKSLLSIESARQSSDNFRQRLSKSLLNVLWAIVTGSRFTDEAELDELIALMEKRAKGFQMAGGRLSRYPWLRFVAPEWSGFGLIDRLNRKLKALIKRTIDDHKKTYSAHETRDFIDAFLHEMNATKSLSFTEDQLITVCLDLFIAGSQTTSSSLDFLIFLMITHPEVQDKVRREIDSVLQPEQDASIVDKIKMPFTEAVLLESQRFTPTAPLLGPRRALSNTVIGGYDIPKGFTVFNNLYPYYRDETKWPNPHNFDPESNFFNNERLTKDEKYIAFGKGKRRCPGDTLAKSFMFIFFVSIIQRYKLKMNDPEKPPSLKILSGITCTPRNYEFRFIPRR